MGTTTAGKLDHATLEVLRPRAADQVEKGAQPEDVAEALCLYGWLAKFRPRGLEALRARRFRAARPKLSASSCAACTR